MLFDAPANPVHSQAEGSQASSSDTRAVAAAVLGLIAGWVAAGSVGLLAHPLRRALTLAFLAAAVLTLSLPPRRTRLALLGFIVALAVAAAMIASSLTVVNISGAALILVSLAAASWGRNRSVLLSASAGVTALALYRVAYTTIPLVWIAADSLGGRLGGIAGRISARSLNVGATFAGLDYLIVMLTLWATWTATTRQPRTKRFLYGLAAILCGHLCYLIALSYAPDLLAAVPVPTGQEKWSWVGLIRKAIPWDLPVLACGVYSLIAAAMFRWSACPATCGGSQSQTCATTEIRNSQSAIRNPAVLCLLAAALLPVATSLYPARPDLQGKKIVFYEEGFLNWLQPTHDSYGRLGSGMYGMLPGFVESLGARAVRSKDLSDNDLRDADALVLIFPDKPWLDGQLERIWSFVRRGGSLLVLGEHTTRDRDGSSRFNDVLAPSDLRVEFDSATFAVGGWLQSYEAIIHPATAGIPDDRNQLGIVIGASVRAGWRTRPIAVGRWGWSDWGDEGSSRAMLGNDRYDPGEKLGDVLLAAEQPIGKGKIVAFGDTSSLTNGINVSAHVFTSRLLAYLADGSSCAHALWRQLLGVLLAGGLIALLIRRPTEWTIVSLVLGLAGSLFVVTLLTSRTWGLPDGRSKSPNNLAYIDASHIEGHSGESWRGDGVGGLVLTLMRNGYLTFSLPQVTVERLQRAGLFISIAPHRPFSKSQRAAVRDFVTRGGIFIMMVGYDDAGPSRPLLSDFGFDIAADPLTSREPVPMGHFKSPYLRSEDQRVHVRFHAAWPVVCSDPEAQVIAYGRDNLPVIIVRRVGAGKVVVIGDTRFATNDNLEREDGEPFEGLRENADFWRWFLTQLRDEPAWVPPALRGEQNPGDMPSPGGAAGKETP